MLSFTVTQKLPDVNQSFNSKGTDLVSYVEPGSNLNLVYKKRSSITYTVEKIFESYTKTNEISTIDSYLPVKTKVRNSINFTILDKKTKSPNVRIIKTPLEVFSTIPRNYKNDIILTKSQIEIHSYIIETEVDSGNSGFKDTIDTLKTNNIEIQKGKIYTYTFPNKFLDNLTSSRIVTKVSATTIVVRPTDYGDITLYCDGGSINFKIAPGLTIEVGDS